MTGDFAEDLADACTREECGVFIVHEVNGQMNITFRNFSLLTPNYDGDVDDFLARVRNLLEQCSE